MASLNHRMRYLNPYDMHKLLINEYVLKYPGDTNKFKRDTSRDRTDFHVIRDNHKFLWDENETPDTWELQFAKKYYDKLFKEYCIGDLSLYKENKIALRWRVEKEVVMGKGQFMCGNKRCNEEDGLRTWEVNFAYKENDERKNALVKIRLCPDCSKKLNYHSKKREVKRLNKRRQSSSKKPKNISYDGPDQEVKSSTSSNLSIDMGKIAEIPSESTMGSNSMAVTEESPWEHHKPVEQKSRDEEMEEYLQELLC